MDGILVVIVPGAPVVSKTIVSVKGVRVDDGLKLRAVFGADSGA